ncbi:YpmA family protein [Halobacillus yeomjeoni]|uniref:YpmA family protein n=1 Tax=Halobacillus yeomjeoni TaxID=311194 RepID=A0A931MUR3_9BACI|nr:YpmA family protein [Halobacillus yeomjeoni]MBH0229559.1 YpmA family protein [Halobacillus yeomjeoni]MCA0983050.1 YpmA family protein [Halobacillus yeomjeoni]
MDKKIETLSTVRIKKTDDLYKLVDTLNRTLKEENLMFGMALDDEDDQTAVFTIYRT